MSAEKIAAIRARHEDATWRYYELPSRLHDDRATLLAEIERLRADNERLYNEDTKTRHALKGWVFVCPDGGADPTHERVAAVVAEIERLRAERDEARAEVRIRPAVYVLLSDDREIEGRDRQSDEICGCYLSLEAAERAGNELNVRWRIEEYGLEDTP